MLYLESKLLPLEETPSSAFPVAFHPTFYPTYNKLQKWLKRFLIFASEPILNDLMLVYLQAKKQYLDHRDSNHIFRLVLSIHYMQQKLISPAIFASQIRNLAVRWIPTDLLFPFSSKPVLGCLIGFNFMDRYEIFDEENIIFSLQKYFPELQLVKESFYRHVLQHDDLRIFYFEIEKKTGQSFSLLERKALKEGIEERIKSSVQKLSPSVFMNLNDEEAYKNLIVLSREITSIHDIPQVYITLERHEGKEIVFHVALVQISPFHRFSFKDRVFGCSIVLDRELPIRFLNGHPVEAYLFRLFLPREPSLLRSDGSLDFYSARQRVVFMLRAVIGEFRDYNGGFLIKQQELLASFKNEFPEEIIRNVELLETFFYSLFPIEKQATLDPKILTALYIYFLRHQQEKVLDAFSFYIYHSERQTFIIIRGADCSINEAITSVMDSSSLKVSDKNMVYNYLFLLATRPNLKH